MSMISSKPIITHTEHLEVNWARELYRVTDNTLEVADRRRRCWICHGKFNVGDGMTIANTARGNKTLHTRCYNAQDGAK